MIHALKLEEAIEYRDRLKALLTFERGLAEWGGNVRLTFGSYVCDVSMVCVGSELRAVLMVEKAMLVHSLQLLGVEVPP